MPPIEFTPVYMLLLEKHDGTFTIATGGSCHNKPLIAREGNEHILESEVGRKLLESKVIDGFQLIKTCKPPVKSYEVDELAVIRLENVGHA